MSAAASVCAIWAVRRAARRLKIGAVLHEAGTGVFADTIDRNRESRTSPGWV